MSEHGDDVTGYVINKKINDVRKGDVILLHGKPCRVVEMKKSKPGKHGHAKTAVTGIDIFTEKKVEEIMRHDAQEVKVDKYEMLLIGIEDRHLSLMDKEGNTREDLLLPDGDLGEKIKEEFEKGTQVNLQIWGAMGGEHVKSWSEDKS